MRAHKPRLEKTRYANIYKVDTERYEIRVSLGKNPVTGKYQKRSEQFHGKLKDARARQAEMQTEARAGRNNITGWTMTDLVDAYFDYADDRLEVQHVRVQKSRWNVIKADIGSFKVRSIKPRDIDNLLSTLKSKRGIKNQTLNRYRAFLSAVFKQGLRWGAVSTNPVADVLSFTPEHVARQAINVDLVQHVFSYLDATSPEMGRFMRIALLLGARRGEVCGLRVGDFDATTNKLTIARAVKEAGGGEVVVGDTKNHATRTFTVGPDVAEVIKAQIDHQRRSSLMPSTAFLFSADGGNSPWRPGRPTLIMQRLKARMCPNCGKVANQPKAVCECGVVVGVDLTIHNLRRLATTAQLRAGVNPRFVQYRGGWRDQKTMLEHYSDHLEEDAAASSAALQTLLPAPGARDGSSIGGNSNRAS